MAGCAPLYTLIVVSPLKLQRFCTLDHVRVITQLRFPQQETVLRKIYKSASGPSQEFATRSFC